MSSSLIKEYMRLFEEFATLADAGRHEEAQRAVDRLKDVGSSVSPIHLAQALVASAKYARERGQLTTAIDELERALVEIARVHLSSASAETRFTIRGMKATASSLLASAQYANRQADEGRRSYTLAIQEAEALASDQPSKSLNHLEQAGSWRLELIECENDATAAGTVDRTESLRFRVDLVRETADVVRRMEEHGVYREELPRKLIFYAFQVALATDDDGAFEQMEIALSSVLDDAYTLADNKPDPDDGWLVSQYLASLATAFVRNKRLEDAIPHLERSLELGRTHGPRSSFASDVAGFVASAEEELGALKTAVGLAGFITASRTEPQATSSPGPAPSTAQASEPPSTRSRTTPSVEDAGDRTEDDDEGLRKIHALLDDPTNIAGYAAQGGDPNVARRDGTPLLVAAAASVEPEVTELLLRNDADVTARDRRRRTALHLAATRDDDRIARTLLEHGADPTAEDEDGWTPATYAAAWGSQPDIVRLLADRGADLTSATNGPLVGAAAFQSRPGMIAAFSALGADADTRLPAQNGGDAPTALMIAALRNERPDVVRALIDAGADVLATTDDGLTAAHFAAARTDGRHAEVLSILADAGADLGTTSHDGMNVDAVVQAYQASQPSRATS